MLEQITRMSDYIHKINTSGEDLTYLEKLKLDTANKKTVAGNLDENPATYEELKLSGYPFQPRYDEYVEKIKCTRDTLVERCKSTLANPIARRLNQQTEGVPFVDDENDPPQVESIKKLVNSLYSIECAAKYGKAKNPQWIPSWIS